MDQIVLKNVSQAATIDQQDLVPTEIKESRHRPNRDRTKQKNVKK